MLSTSPPIYIPPRPVTPGPMLEHLFISPPSTPIKTQRIKTPRTEQKARRSSLHYDNDSVQISNLTGVPTDLSILIRDYMDEEIRCVSCSALLHEQHLEMCEFHVSSNACMCPFHENRIRLRNLAIGNEKRQSLSAPGVEYKSPFRDNYNEHLKRSPENCPNVKARKEQIVRWNTVNHVTAIDRIFPC